MENRFLQHIQEKAPAYALAVVVGIGSLALVGEGNGQKPGKVTDGDQPNPTLGIEAPAFDHEQSAPPLETVAQDQFDTL